MTRVSVVEETFTLLKGSGSVGTNFRSAVTLSMYVNGRGPAWYTEHACLAVTVSFYIHRGVC
jgi:hypothetical protein